MSRNPFQRPPYLDPQIDYVKIILIGALFLILLVGAVLWPYAP